MIFLLKKNCFFMYKLLNKILFLKIANALPHLVFNQSRFYKAPILSGGLEGMKTWISFLHFSSTVQSSNQ